MSVYNDKHRAYTNKYLVEKYDSTIIRLPKGMKEEVKSFAKKQGKSVNGFVVELIKNAMNKSINN